MSEASYEATPPPETSEESQGAELKPATLVKLEASTDKARDLVAETMEEVLVKVEASGNASDASVPYESTSSSSDGETTALLQRAHQMQHGEMKSTPEQGEVAAPARKELRRSTRKKRAVDVLSPSENVAGQKSPHKRRTMEKKIKMEILLSARPAAEAAAAARAVAAAKEKKRAQAAAKRSKAGGKGAKSPKGVLSPMQDEKKKTPKKKRSRKARRSLEPSYSFDSETEYVSNLIAELYEEQEQDDRGMYSITRDTVVNETSACKRSQEVEDLSMEDFRRLMTYGEVSVESVASTILPFLKLEEDDVFFDLGCGTGKILVQAALQTPCKEAYGIELMNNRVLEGHKALKRLKERDLTVLQGKRIEVLLGDICAPPENTRLMDATVVFINNVMFGPALMLKVMALLKDMSKLRRVVTLRKICERHGHEKCKRAGNYCVDYVHPPEEAKIDVSWADKTQVFLYENLDYSLRELRRLMIAADQ
ncbi:unnamed protein product [Phytophthora lilii]|uniref:Histone-lysine N-methyltransferase, H3 lysine-79 specific n=1 Tax=Phytophthora lilii TaxID=2077276 RepID=A0A9W6YDW6_9STRA|nr:unnamed protein product [Phytophthora lilii]